MGCRALISRGLQCLQVDIQMPALAIIYLDKIPHTSYYINKSL
jgi:hypothetical protein